MVGISSGLLLKRWLPLHLAMGLGWFAAGFLMGLIYTGRSKPRYGVPRWVAVALIAIVPALFVGFLSYYFPW